jgi:hypothetical protein
MLSIAALAFRLPSSPRCSDPFGAVPILMRPSALSQYGVMVTHRSQDPPSRTSTKARRKIIGKGGVPEGVEQQHYDETHRLIISSIQVWQICQGVSQSLLCRWRPSQFSLAHQTMGPGALNQRPSERPSPACCASITDAHPALPSLIQNCTKPSHRAIRSTKAHHFRQRPVRPKVGQDAPRMASRQPVKLSGFRPDHALDQSSQSSQEPHNRQLEFLFP